MSPKIKRSCDPFSVRLGSGTLPTFASSLLFQRSHLAKVLCCLWRIKKDAINDFPQASQNILAGMETVAYATGSVDAVRKAYAALNQYHKASAYPLCSAYILLCNSVPKIYNGSFNRMTISHDISKRLKMEFLALSNALLSPAIISLLEKIAEEYNIDRCAIVLKEILASYIIIGKDRDLEKAIERTATAFIDIRMVGLFNNCDLGLIDYAFSFVHWHVNLLKYELEDAIKNIILAFENYAGEKSALIFYAASQQN